MVGRDAQERCQRLGRVALATTRRGQPVADFDTPVARAALKPMPPMACPSDLRVIR
jgi:hypothetical protein